MDDGVDVRAGLVGLGMDEAFGVDRTIAPLDRLAVEVELHDVLGRHTAGRLGGRHEETIRSRGMPHADMAEAVDHALPVEDAVGGHEIVDQRLEIARLRRRARVRRDRAL